MCDPTASVTSDFLIVTVTSTRLTLTAKSGHSRRLVPLGLPITSRFAATREGKEMLGALARTPSQLDQLLLSTWGAPPQTSEPKRRHIGFGTPKGTQARQPNGPGNCPWRPRATTLRASLELVEAFGKISRP